MADRSSITDDDDVPETPLQQAYDLGYSDGYAAGHVRSEGDWKIRWNSARDVIGALVCTALLALCAWGLFGVIGLAWFWGAGGIISVIAGWGLFKLLDALKVFGDRTDA